LNNNKRKPAHAFLSPTRYRTDPQQCGLVCLGSAWWAHGLPWPIRPGSLAWPGPVVLVGSIRGTTLGFNPNPPLPPPLHPSLLCATAHSRNIHRFPTSLPPPPRCASPTQHAGAAPLLSTPPPTPPPSPMALKASEEDPKSPVDDPGGSVS
jgi:hypothetical protein